MIKPGKVYQRHARRVHPETVPEILHVLVDHPQRVFDPFQDLLPRESGGTISGFSSSISVWKPPRPDPWSVNGAV